MDATPDRSAERAAHYAHCERLVYEGDRDAWIASLFAPQERRPQLHALRAFALELSGVRSKVSQALLGEMRLRWWIDAFAGGEGARAHPVADALLDVVEKTGIAPDDLDDFVEAHVFDLYDDPMATLEALESYCRRTGGRLAGWCAAALGTNAAGRAAAEAAGVALQMTRLLAGLPQQSAAGQVFLPATLLARRGVAPDDIRAARDSAGLRAALAELRAAIRARLTEARAAAAAAPAEMRAALLPAAVVPLWLDLMERKDYAPLQPLAEPPQWRRQWRIWRASRGVGL